jgi:hypothetical protein
LELTAARTRKNRRIIVLNTVQKIEAAIEKLSPRERRELAAWFEERRALLNAADALFQVYDSEEQGK